MNTIPSPASEYQAVPRGSRNACLLRRLIQTYTNACNIPIASLGCVKFRSIGFAGDSDADEFFYVRNEWRVRGKKGFQISAHNPPDLGIEVDLAKSGLAKDDFYAKLGIGELWRYQDEKLIVRELSRNGEFSEARASSNLPGLPLTEVQRFMGARYTMGETQWICSFRRWIEDFSQV